MGKVYRLPKSPMYRWVGSWGCGGRGGGGGRKGGGRKGEAFPKKSKMNIYPIVRTNNICSFTQSVNLTRIYLHIINIKISFTSGASYHSLTKKIHGYDSPVPS